MRRRRRRRRGRGHNFNRWRALANDSGTSSPMHPLPYSLLAPKLHGGKGGFADRILFKPKLK